MTHEVIQADEDAAIDVRKHESVTGYINHDALAQAFAAHRIEATRNAVKAERERCAKVCESLKTCGCNYTHGACNEDAPYDIAAEAIRGDAT